MFHPGKAAAALLLAGVAASVHDANADVVELTWKVDPWVVDFKRPTTHLKRYEARKPGIAPKPCVSCARRRVGNHCRRLAHRAQRPDRPGCASPPRFGTRRPAARQSPFAIPEANRKAAMLVNGQ